MLAVTNVLDPGSSATTDWFGLMLVTDSLIIASSSERVVGGGAAAAATATATGAAWWAHDVGDAVDAAATVVVATLRADTTCCGAGWYR